METITQTTLVASQGMVLTQANRTEEQEPIVVTIVSLNRADSADNWQEVTIEEGERILAEWNAEQEIKMRMEVQHGNN
jgi:co-chaperonin GroES (HSP10)